ncbi:MAG TPA: hypothetical protein DEP28_07465 [Bacteroidetes bacterium]|nr:hypothetical protein [Bacteroidota bacterium]
MSIIAYYDSYVKSILNTLIIGKEKVIDEEDKYKYFGNSMILTFDDHITEVGLENIKLLSSNLFEPGLIFTALSKEIVTICSATFLKKRSESSVKRNLINLKHFFENHPKTVFKKYSNFFIDFDYSYGVTDYIRYKYFFKSNFDLFLFYHIGFLIQYPKMYDLNGNINKSKLFIEIYRLFVLNEIILRIDGKDHIENIRNFRILPEVSGLWSKYFQMIEEFYRLFVSSFDTVSDIFAYLKSNVEDNIENLNYNNLIEPKKPEDYLSKKFLDLSYDFMDAVFNKGKIVEGVSRIWNNGKVCKEYIKTKDNSTSPYFLFDSQGGSFFINFENLSEYSKLRNEAFENLRYLSLEHKAFLLNKIINEEGN